MSVNTSTKKKYNDVATKSVEYPAHRARVPSTPNKPGMYDGQMASPAREEFAEPMNKGVVGKIEGGIAHTHDDIGEKSGFINDGYTDKNGTPFGEAAKFNFLPPGMDISNQENAEINNMPLKKLTDESYPDDGWMPKPKDITE